MITSSKLLKCKRKKFDGSLHRKITLSKTEKHIDDKKVVDHFVKTTYRTFLIVPLASKTTRPLGDPSVRGLNNNLRVRLVRFYETFNP
jgi:hypothetical protein